MSLEGIPSEHSKEQMTANVSVRVERGLDWVAAHRHEFGAEADEEVLCWAALSAEDPTRREAFLGRMRRDKPHIADPEGFFARVAGAYAEHPAPDVDHGQEVARWNESLPEVRKRIASIRKFFRPQTAPERVTLVPADALVGSTSGRAFDMGRELLIASHSENLDNVAHEYLHAILNPLVERLAASLSPEQRTSLIARAGSTLREEYGNNESVLYEEFIRTYNDWFARGEQPLTLEAFSKRLHEYDEQAFRTMVVRNPRIAERFRTLGIASLAELSNRAGEYYDRFERDDLRERLYALYKAYEADSGGVGFEQYVSERVRDLLPQS